MAVRISITYTRNKSCNFCAFLLTYCRVPGGAARLWSLTFFKPFPECVRRALGRILDPDTPHLEITTLFDFLT